MDLNFESHFKSYLQKHFLKAKEPAQKLLRQALFYSLLAKASHFRPKLCFAVTKILEQNPKKILPWAMAIEMIHTASLIQDDLPFMDNAKIRRGKKCNHLVFGEDVANLAGMCLFVESFKLLSEPVFNKKRAEVLKLLVDKAGFYGLMSGQALDLKQKQSSKKDFFKMIELKTGSLISACVLGPLLLWGKKQTEIQALKSYAKYLGRAYQLADDLQDKEAFFKPKKQALQELSLATEQSLKSLKALGKKASSLEKLSLLNQKRVAP